MSIFLEEINQLTAEQLKAQGSISSMIKDAGCHDVIIKKMYETDGGSWKSMTIDFVTPAGETIAYNGFFGVPKSTSSEDIDKAKAQTSRTLADIARIVKAAGLQDAKVAAAGATVETDDKGRPITVFPKVANKKLIITTYTVIDGQKKDGQIVPDKVFVKQEFNSYKVLDKDGKDQMGRDCRESYDAEAKATFEIAYGYEKNPKHLAKLAELQEKFAGSQVTVAPISGMPTGMPTAQVQTNVVPVDDDI